MIFVFWENLDYVQTAESPVGPNQSTSESLAVLVIENAYSWALPMVIQQVWGGALESAFLGSIPSHSNAVSGSRDRL